MTNPSAHRPQRLRLWPLVGVVFFIVCGGTYGLEGIVEQVGPWWSVVLVLAIPFLWSLPIGLMAAELTTLMPEDGGYYRWINQELGPFWGSQAGWWALCASLFDMSLYPVLFARYLSYVFPALGADEPLARWGIAMALVLTAFALNAAGIRTVGRNAVLVLGLVLTPLLLASVLVLARSGAAPFAALAGAAGQPMPLGSLVVGLALVMWNYQGWDNGSTFAREVEHPQRNYPRALAVVLALTITVYLVPLLAGLALFPEPSHWREWTLWPQVGERAAGPWLAIAVTAAGLAAQWSLLNSGLLYGSRLPFAMAQDGWLPAPLARSSPRTGAPIPALVLLVVVMAALIAWPFEKLLLVDVLVTVAVLALEFAVLLRLRFTAPHRPRPFRVPGGWPGAIAATAGPMACGAMLLWATLLSAGSLPQLGVIAAIVCAGLALYALRRGRLRAPESPLGPMQTGTNRVT